MVLLYCRVSPALCTTGMPLGCMLACAQWLGMACPQLLLDVVDFRSQLLLIVVVACSLSVPLFMCSVIALIICFSRLQHSGCFHCSCTCHGQIVRVPCIAAWADITADNPFVFRNVRSQQRQSHCYCSDDHSSQHIYEFAEVMTGV